MAKELALPIVLHLAAALPAVVLGVLQLARKKGTSSHKVLGWAWVVAMAVLAISSFWIFGLARGGGFSWIHLLSAWTLFSLATAVWFIRHGKVRAHKYFMAGTFIGLAGAGLGALAPGRMLYLLLFA